MMLEQPSRIPTGNMATSSPALAIPMTRSRSLNPYPDYRSTNHNGTSHHQMGSHSSPDIDREDDVLSPLPGLPPAASSPGALSRSPGMRLGCLSPQNFRRRSNTMDSYINSHARNLTGAQTAPATLSLAKDPIQPKQGSIQDIHSDEREENEEDDVFMEFPVMRQRSSTCPANMARARRVKIRTMNRPGTPPPMDLEFQPHSNHLDNTHHQKLSHSEGQDKNHILNGHLSHR